ncbi:hypothetical protein C0J52_02290 [Blattella germanica]|nr:hypothetical protein C0J52_02290 [Blattella germanica]
MSMNYIERTLIPKSEVKEHRNCVIDFEKSDNKQISAYYSHVKSLCDKPQKKIEHYLKPNK